MILVVGSTKGGVGKSTITTNLAIIRASMGHDVLVIDADMQTSAADFGLMRAQRLGTNSYRTIRLLGPEVRTEGQEIAKKYEDTIIDCAARDNQGLRAALAIADLVIVPCRPRAFDAWALEDFKKMFDEMLPANERMRAWSFINQGEPVGDDNEEAAELLASVEGVDYRGCTVTSRKVFGHAAAMGLAVTEMTPRNDKACDEIMAVYKEVFDG